jgi:hypothetical protein
MNITHPSSSMKTQTKHIMVIGLNCGSLMTILASHTLEIQNYLFIRFIIILLITKNITKIITKIAEVSHGFHFGASGSLKVSLAEVLVGKGSPKFPFWGVPGPPPQSGAAATKMADF